MEVDDPARTGGLVQAVDVLGGEQPDSADVLELRQSDGARRSARPPEAAPADQAARPVARPHRRIAHERLELDRLLTLPVTVDVAVVGDPRLRAATRPVSTKRRWCRATKSTSCSSPPGGASTAGMAIFRRDGSRTVLMVPRDYRRPGGATLWIADRGAAGQWRVLQGWRYERGEDRVRRGARAVRAARDDRALCARPRQHGFVGTMAADHFQPWVPQQGQASYVWNVLSAVGQRTTGDLGPGVTCPTFRHHPAIVAQAAATLEAMYPDRTWLGLGSGEALNEHVFGGYWPEAPERIRMMFEAVEIIQKLFTGKDVKHAGEFFKLHTTRLWTLPTTRRRSWSRRPARSPPRRPVRVATASSRPARRPRRSPGCWPSSTKGPCRRARTRATMPKLLQLHLSWAPTDEEALDERDDRVAQRRHEVRQAGRALAVRLRSRWRSSSAPRTSRAGW